MGGSGHGASTPNLCGVGRGRDSGVPSALWEGCRWLFTGVPRATGVGRSGQSPKLPERRRGESRVAGWEEAVECVE